MRTFFNLLALLLLACTTPQATAASADLPVGMSFVGLVKDEWRLFVVDASGARAVKTAGEPRTPAYSAHLQRVAYISSAGELRELDLKTATDTVLLRPSVKVAYTQPAYRPQTDELYVVALRDGSSIETDIARVDRIAKRTVTVLHQRSAQFEPAFSADGAQLLYSNVACASECPKVLQEIWTMDVVGGISEQRTLLNAISRQPVSSDAGVIFVSNAGGSYALWKSTASGEATRLTHDSVLAESPVVSDSRTIFFIERSPQGGVVVALGEDGTTRPVALPTDIKDVRDLRWGGR